MNDLSDELLMDQLKKGDNRALETLYERYYSVVGNYYLRFFNGDQELARDMSQELFVRLMIKRHTFENGRKFSPWFFSMACNLAKNQLRKANNERLFRENQSLEADQQEVPAEWLVNNRNRLLMVKISELKEKHRVMIEQKYFLGKCIPDIAKELGIKEGTAKSRLYHALKILSGKIQGLIEKD